MELINQKHYPLFKPQLDRIGDGQLYYVRYCSEQKTMIMMKVDDKFDEMTSNLVFKSYVGKHKDIPFFVKPTN